MSAVPLDAQIACVRREIAMRQSAYPKWVANGRLTQQKADAEIRAMIAVLATLQGIAAGQAAAAFKDDRATAGVDALRALLVEWLDGEYDGQDFLRRVRIAIYGPGPRAGAGPHAPR